MRPSRYSGRRYCSAFGASLRPHCASGVRSRTAVSASCSFLRRRTCMCAAPAATSGTPARSPACCNVVSQAASSGPRISSQAIQLRPGSSCCNHRASRSIFERAVSDCRCPCGACSGLPSEAPAGAKEGTSSASVSTSRWACAARSAAVSRYSPLGAARRARVISSDRLPYPVRVCASSTRCGPSAIRISVPWIRRNSLAAASSQRASRSARCARTAPAKEHSSVIASPV